jgi:hypothetical protein
MSRLSRNIALACEHPEGLATLHQDEKTAWCPVCEADVEVRHLTPEEFRAVLKEEGHGGH